MKTKLLTSLLLISSYISVNIYAQNLSNIYSFINKEKVLNQNSNNLSSIVQINDSISYWLWDTIGSKWQISSKDINFVYDLNNHQISSIKLRWDGSDWWNYYKSIFSYDTYNNQTSYLDLFWDGSAWIDFCKYTYTYDSKNNKTSYIKQQWLDSTWMNRWKYIYTYDTNNYQTSYFDFSWNGSAWGIQYKCTYTFDANNNQVSYLILRWDDSTWVINFKGTYTYDANNNRTSYLIQSWDGSNWGNNQISTYTYDANNNLSGYLEQFWDDNKWVNEYTYSYTYDANNFQKSASCIRWKWSSNELDGIDSTYYYFHTVVGINDFTIKDNNIDIYPNPNTGKFVINSNIALTSIVVYNLTGELQYSNYNLNRQTSIEIDLSNLQKGIYFARIQDRKQVVTEKIIIQ